MRARISLVIFEEIENRSPNNKKGKFFNEILRKL